MEVCILMGSPRKNGNTAALIKPLVKELEYNEAKVNTITLYDKKIEPCIACRSCQDAFGIFGCPKEDDVQGIFDEILHSDVFVLATPIYSWYCTPPMKALLDRLVYGMNKYYGEFGNKECLWKGKKCAIISTCGYPVEKGADIFEEGIKRYCRHSKLSYLGMLSVRDEGYGKEFMDCTAAASSKEFATKIARSRD